jgi:hypothetical protein
MSNNAATSGSSDYRIYFEGGLLKVYELTAERLLVAEGRAGNGGIILGDDVPDAPGEFGYRSTVQPGAFGFYGAGGEDFYIQVGSSADTVAFESLTGVVNIDASTQNMTLLTLDTGFGANELYDMDQHVLTTSAPTFAGVTLTSDIDTNADAVDWDLLDDNASALSFDAAGKAGILAIVTSNTTEGVTMSGTLSVTGTLGAAAITATGLVTGDSFALGDTDYIGITGNEIITFNAAGTIVASGATFSAAGGTQSLTPVADTAANFAANFTGANLYGGTFICNAAGTLQLPAVAVGMNFTIITLGAIAVSADTNINDLMILDGTALNDGDKATNLSTAGDIIVFQYYDATGWVATSNGWTDGGA